jgi:alpha-1,3-rhamnosyltransferase
MGWFLLTTNNGPLVSVILPSYNHAKYVEKAILSIVYQTYPNIELIVIDDGSTDGSADVIEKLQKQYEFIFIRQENRGVYQAITRGLDVASGDYISPFSSDDIYCEDKISILVKLLESNPRAAVSYGRISLIDETGRQTKEIIEPYRSGRIFAGLLRGDYFINGLSALVRKDVYIDAREGGYYVDDLPIWLSIAEKHEFVFVNKVLAFHRRHHNHLTGNLLEVINSEALILERYKEAVGYSDALKRWNLRWFYGCSIRYKIRSVRYLASSFSLRNFGEVRLYWGLVRLILFWPGRIGIKQKGSNK